MKATLILLACLFIPAGLDSAPVGLISDDELIEAIDATTILGRMARGTWEWSS